MTRMVSRPQDSSVTNLGKLRGMRSKGGAVAAAATCNRVQPSNPRQKHRKQSS